MTSWWLDIHYISSTKRPPSFQTVPLVIFPPNSPPPGLLQRCFQAGEGSETWRKSVSHCSPAFRLWRSRPPPPRLLRSDDWLSNVGFFEKAKVTWGFPVTKTVGGEEWVIVVRCLSFRGWFPPLHILWHSSLSFTTDHCDIPFLIS